MSTESDIVRMQADLNYLKEKVRELDQRTHKLNELAIRASVITGIAGSGLVGGVVYVVTHLNLM